MPPIDLAAHELPVRIACIGDSITEGAGAEPGKFYPSQLQELLGEKWKVQNFGVSGRKMPLSLPRSDSCLLIDVVFLDCIVCFEWHQMKKNEIFSK